jgi:hypothetical protein
MAGANVVAAADLELRGEAGRLQVRILLPEWDEERAAWACRFEIDPPLSREQAVYGETSLQALSLALKIMSSELYGSKAYKDGRLGSCGEFGGYLGFPAPKESLNHAPYPF